MSPSVNGGQRYDVIFSAQIRDKINELNDQANGQGRGPEFVSALREIADQLRHRPHLAGEPNFHLPVMRLHVRTVCFAPIVVQYAINDDRPVVYIRSVYLLS